MLPIMTEKKIHNAKLFFFIAALLIAVPTVLKLYTGETGKILIATNKVNSDKNFRETVIYINKHSVWGAVGIILNRPSLPEEERQKIPTEAVKRIIYKGGPVGLPHAKFVALEAPNAISAIRTQELFVMPYESFLKLFPEKTEQEMVVYIGYSGWSSGQLEREIGYGAWIVKDYDAEFFHKTPVDEWWAQLSENN